MKKFIFFTIIAFSIILIAQSCKENDIPDDTLPDYLYSFISPNPQVPGDPQIGYDYLVAGDYLAYGIPLDIYKFIFPEDNSNELGRTGENAKLPYNFTTTVSPNGIDIVNQNCLTCHASHFNGELIVGLGNSLSDYSEDLSGTFTDIDAAIELLYGNDSEEWKAYEPFRNPSLAAAPYTIAPFKGVNPADKLFVVLAAHRDPNSFVWQESPRFHLPQELIATDVPPWWLIKKKHAYLYTAMGRGDFSSILMAASMLTMKDSSEARDIIPKFRDVLAYLYTIEAPEYPEVVDQSQAEQGRTIFKENCAVCHGNYDEGAESYPNLLVNLETIQTDSMLVYSNYNGEFLGWHNSSWFGRGEYGSEFVAGNGYVAPPLDGVWVTAPYLHNGSVPDLYTLLNSYERPTYWRRTFDDSDYNYTQVGWNYTLETGPTDANTYNTTLTGYSNSGHYFGDALTDEERWALIEYLKTL